MSEGSPKYTDSRVLTLYLDPTQSTSFPIIHWNFFCLFVYSFLTLVFFHSMWSYYSLERSETPCSPTEPLHLEGSIEVDDSKLDRRVLNSALWGHFSSHQSVNGPFPHGSRYL